MKSDMLNLNQCPKDNLEREYMKNITHILAVGSICMLKYVVDLILL